MGHLVFVAPALPDDVYKREVYQRHLKKYLRSVCVVDDGIATLVAHLASTGELASVIIL